MYLIFNKVQLNSTANKPRRHTIYTLLQLLRFVYNLIIRTEFKI